MGEVVWQRNYGVQNRNEYLEDMTSCRDGGFILAGDRPRTDKPYLVRINAQGDILWENNFLGNDEVWCSTNAGSIVQLPDNGFAFAGHNSGITMMLRTDEAGNFQWSRYNNFGADGNSFFTTILCDESGGIIAGGSLWTLEHNVEGLLVKYIPDRTPPYFRSFEPDSLALIVLLNDNIHFEVHARDLQDDSIRYVWTYVADTVSTDSMVTIQFRELGDWTVRCAISDGDEEIFIEWQVEVSNFFIRSASPHEFDLIARRNSTILFSLDVACVEPDQWTTEWTMVDRNLRRNPLGEEDSLDVCFDMAGDCAVEAVIEWRGEEERLRWDVAVRSAVWWWDPHQDTVTVYRDSSAEFNVIPFNRESDSLSFEWTLNGRLMDWDESLLVMDFMDNMDLGGHELKVVCRDGSEADTIGWAVQVIPREGAPFAEALRPAEPRLYPPAPNPFNFTTTISFSLPARAPVSLRIYDLNGRLLQDLSPLGSLNPGQHEVVWNARKLPTGIYFVRLESGGRSAVRRTFLLK